MSANWKSAGCRRACLLEQGGGAFGIAELKDADCVHERPGGQCREVFFAPVKD